MIIYRAGDDSRIDRANIARLKRVTRLSTTPVQLEIYYHAPLQLGAWSDPQDGVRYIRLRSNERIPLAEKISAAGDQAVLVLNDSVLIAAADVWQLMGHASRQGLVVLSAQRILRHPRESSVQFFLRESIFRLQAYLYPQGTVAPENFAIRAAEFCAERGISRRSFSERLALAGLTGDLVATRPVSIAGRSFAVGRAGRLRLMNTLAETIRAIAHWRKSKAFPWWFSPRYLLFHVAQLSVYLGALVAMVSLEAGCILVAFAILITPRFALSGLGLSRPWLWPVRLLFRIGAYLLG